jgi:Uma2 family endonuclease
MSTATPPALMTADQMLALPDNGMDRELIRGELRESPMTLRNRDHSSLNISISYALRHWLQTRPEPRGRIVGGEAGFRLKRDPDTFVGIDIAYVSADVVTGTPESFPYFEGPPILAVEILSPSDTQEKIDEKIDLYLETGVPLVWIVNAVRKTILVHRAGQEPELFNVRHEIADVPELPGFRAAVAELLRY